MCALYNIIGEVLLLFDMPSSEKNNVFLCPASDGFHVLSMKRFYDILCKKYCVVEGKLLGLV